MRKIITLFVALLSGSVCVYSAPNTGADDAMDSYTGTNLDVNTDSDTNAGDPFTRYLSSVARPLRTIASERQDGISIKSLVYSSRDGINEVYAIIAEPVSKPASGPTAKTAAEPEYPAILFLHGGGSCAEDLKGNLLRYARAGYVAMAIDQPGLCGTGKTSYTVGPWKSRPGGEGPRLDVRNGAQNSTIVDAEIAGIEAINYLAALPNVDSERIGITGWSWGGYSTTMLSGLLGSKIKAAYAVFGCGFWDKGSFWTDKIEALPEAERAVWLEYLDSGRRAHNITAAYFIEAPNGDTFFWPPAVSATLDEIRSDKNHVWAANLNHRQLPSGGEMQMLWFDYHLKGNGTPFCKVGKARTRTIRIDSAKGNDTKRARTGTKITCKIDIPKSVAVKSATLYYSDAQSPWTDREWTPIEMTVSMSGRILEVMLPGQILTTPTGAEIDATVNAIDNPADYVGGNGDLTNPNWFISVEDSRGVVTSGEMYGGL